MAYTATCHCGATKIEVQRAPESLTVCNCTYCAKSGGLWGYYKPEEVTIVSEDEGKVYTATGYNLHHFCGKCGCNTHGDSPDWSLGSGDVPAARRIGLNARLFDDIDIAKIPVETIDGRHLW